ncbi:hypothetical protein V6N12_064151 [Hibiscus sabdariffa]|uniref:Uncharacterized protein n=1 Tax=Hibiscus sabdariffa TaxID=183260 RepID=A0ABR2G4Y5_9ROSI
MNVEIDEHLVMLSSFIAPSHDPLWRHLRGSQIGTVLGEGRGSGWWFWVCDVSRWISIAVPEAILVQSSVDKTANTELTNCED